LKTVAIVGVGLIGGSFGLALKKAGFSGEILGVSSEAAIAESNRRGASAGG
jgi:prephenate dehydrogenase